MQAPLIKLLLILSLFLMGAASPKSEHTGKVQVYVYDYPTHAVEKAVLDDGKQEIELRLPKGSKHQLRNDQRIKVRGYRKGEALEIDSDADLEMLLDPDPATSGGQKIAYLLPTYGDGAVGTSPAGALALATEIDNYYRQQSYGLMWHEGIKDPSSPGDIIPVQIALNSGGCETGTISTQAKDAARAAGWPIDFYRGRVILMVPSPCGWSGLNVGRQPFTNWTSGQYTIRVVAHEMGHGYGLSHAKREDCPGCGAAGEYTDHTDLMANSAGTLGGFQRWSLGWLDRTGTPPIIITSQPGTWTISAIDAPADGLPKAVKILRSGGNFWYVTYRSCTQYHTEYCGIYVHSATDGINGAGTSLLHAWTQYLGDWTLDLGDTFPDNANSRFFSVLSIANGQAVIRVTGPTPLTAPSLLSVQ